MPKRRLTGRSHASDTLGIGRGEDGDRSDPAPAASAASVPPPRGDYANATDTNTSTAAAVAPLVAGVAGGSVSTALLFPLDLVKIRMQVNEESSHRMQLRPLLKSHQHRRRRPTIASSIRTKTKAA